MKKNKTLKRFLAFLLCAAMLITYMPSSVYTLADESADTPEVAADSGDSGAEAKKEAPKKSPAPTAAPAEQAESAPAAEPEAAAEPEESQVEEAQEPETPETRAGPSEDSDVTEEAAEPAEETSEEAVPEGEDAEKEDADKEEKEDENKLNTATKTFTGKANSVNVKVVAQPGTFPEGTTMKVVSVSKGAVRDAVEGALDDVNDFRAVDITFYADGKEVQPKKNVSVKLSTSAFDTDEDLNVVHVKDSGSAEVMSLTSATDTAAQFKSGSFSIYVVVETGDDARLKVVFHKLDGSTAEMMITKRQIPHVQQYIFDPGSGTPEEGVQFKGWTTKEDYTKDDAADAMTIADVREKVIEKLNGSVTDEEPYHVYAMGFKTYTVTFQDEKGIMVKADQVLAPATSTETPSYTVELNYTPYPTEEEGVVAEFLGWQQLQPEISGEMKLHKVGDTFSLTDTNFILKAHTQKGHWMIFEENLSNASYSEPQFIAIGAKATKPTNPTRTGYTFDGWYTEDDTDARDGKVKGSEFNFNNELTANTTVYGKWTPANTADYKVVFWLENKEGTGYDYSGTTLTVSGATVGENTYNIQARGTGDGRYARVYRNNSDYTDYNNNFKGFHLSTVKPNENGYDNPAAVAPEGNTIINVYYDRNMITYNFQYSSSNTKSFTGRYGSDFTEWPDPGDGYVWGIGGYYNRVNFPLPVTEFNPEVVSEGSTDTNITFTLDDYDTRYTLYVYKETEEGKWSYTNDYLIATAPLGGGNWTPTETYIGYTLDSYRIGSWGNWTSCTPSTRIEYGRNNLYLRYSRNQYEIDYNDGIFVDGSGNPVPGIKKTDILDSQTVYYEANTSSYNQKPTKDGFVFLGWYDNEFCAGEPYTFDKMPAHNVTLYAKWGQSEYKVKFHPNDTDDDPIDWNRTSDTSYVPDGDKVGNPGGERNYFDLVGWYTDEEMQHAFDFDAFVLNKTNVEKRGKMYGATEIDPAWPTTIGELNLYAKWRSKLIGAEGIKVVYEAAGGSDAPIDNNSYVDQAEAIALGAAKAADPDNMVFSHWAVQKWNGTDFVDSGVKAFPGDAFDVLAADAKITEEGSDIAVDPKNLDPKKSYTYTVQLKAVYIEKDKEMLTTINWYNNYDGGTVAKNENIKINQAVPIPAAPTRKGYEFKGWIRGFEEDGTTTTLTDLWLTYVKGESGGSYTYDNGKPASQVAADELLVDDGTKHHALYAKWEPNDDELKYNSNGGSGSMTPTKGKVDQGVPVSANGFTAPAGKKFDSWNTAANGSGKTYAAGSTYTLTPEDDILYAQWVADDSQTYDVTYTAENGTITAPEGAKNENIQVLGTTGVTGATAEAAPGYKFEGWYVGETKIAAATTVQLSEAVAKANVTKLENGLYTDTTFKAVFVADEDNTYDVTYTAENGTITAPEGAKNEGIQVLGTEGVTGATAEAAPGYKFDGWYVGETKIAEATTVVLSADDAKANVAKAENGLYTDTTFRAVFVADEDQTYDVTYEAEHGTITAPEGAKNEDIQVLGTTGVTGATAVADPGYKFDGWYKGETKLEGVGEEMSAAEAIANLNHGDGDTYADTTFRAVFVTDDGSKYTVRYSADHGTVTETENVDIQVLSTEGVTGSKATADPGYKFDGWYKGNTKLEGVDEEMSAAEAIANLNHGDGDTYADTSFKAVFVIDEDQTYDVTYEAENGTITAPEGAKNEGIQVLGTEGVSGATAKADPGYKFDGWYVGETKIAAATTVELSEAVAQANVTKLENGLYTDTTFTAKFVADENQNYDVTYEAENGSITTPSPAKNEDIQVLGTEGVTGATAAADPGYKFDGWYVGETKIAAATTVELSEAVAQANVTKLENGLYTDTTFTAKFVADDDQNYDVTYEAEHGTITAPEGAKNEDIQVLGTEGVTGATAKADPGYTFDGWYVGETKIAAATTVELSEAVAKANVTKLDNGLYTDTTFTAKFVADEDQTYDVTYEVNVEKGGSVEPKANKNIQVLSTEGVTGSTAKADPGYKFDGWYKGDAEEPITTEATLSVEDAVANLNHGDGDTYADTTFTAKFSVDDDQTYKVTYKAETGGSVEPKVNEGLQVLNFTGVTGSKAKPDPGYKFVGWFREDGRQIATETTLMQLIAQTNLNKKNGVYADTTYTARFEPDEDQTYDVTYEAENGTITVPEGAKNEGIQVLGTEGVTGATAEAAPGYKFDGWYVGETKIAEATTVVLSADDAKANVAKAENGLYTDTTFKAVFVADEDQTYDVTYEAENGTITAPEGAKNEGIQVLGTEGVTGATAEAAPGYKFDGWYVGDAEEAISTDLTLSADDAKANVAKDEDGLYTDTTFTAKFVIDEDQTYDVTYEAEHGTVSETENLDIQVLSTEGVTGSTATADPGYKFDGWYKGNTKLEGVGAEMTPALAIQNLNRGDGDTYADTTFTAKFVVDDGQTYDVRYNAEHGTVTDTENLDIQVLSTDGVTGSTAEPEADPGYMFDGWYNVETGEKVSEDLELTAEDAIANLNHGDGEAYADTTFTAKFKRSLLTVSKETTSETPEKGYALGDTIEYKITVKNDGEVTISNIGLTDTVAGYEAEDLTSKLEKTELKPGEETSVTFTHKVTEKDVLAKSVKNNATATGSDPKGDDPEIVPGTTEDPTEKKNPDYTVEKSVTNTGSAEGGKYKVGEKVQYEITVTNTGNVTLNSIVVEDTLTAPGTEGAKVTFTELAGGTLNDDNTVTLDTLAIGGSVTLKAEYKITQADVDAQKTITNAATATAKDPEDDDVTPPTPPVVPVDPEEKDPDYSVEKSVTNTGSAEGGKYKVGETVKYEITVTNTGNVTLSDIVVEDTLTAPGNADAKVTFTELAGGTLNEDNTVTFETLAVDESVTLKAEYEITQADVDAQKTITNAATAKAKDPDDDDVTPPTPPVVPVDPEEKDPDYSVEKSVTNTGSAEGGKYKVGEKVQYEITVTNTGNVTLSDIVVEDTLTAPGNADAKVTFTELAGGTLNEDNTVTFETLAVDESVTLKAEYEITQADVDAQKTITNAATAKAKDPDDDDVTPPTPPVVPVDPEEKDPNYSVEKSVTNAGSAEGGKYKVGEKVQYEITVTNTGNVTLSDIVVEDTLTAPGNADAKVTFTELAGGTLNEDNTVTLETLAVGGSVTLKAEYEITQADIDAQKTITNAATAKAKDPDDDDVTPPTPPVVPVDPEEKNPDYSVEKSVTSTGSAEGGKYKVGEKVQYEITVTNTGNVTLSDIVVEDTLTAPGTEGAKVTFTELAGGTLNDDNTVTLETLAVGGSVTLKAEYEITQADIDAQKTITNAATAKAKDPDDDDVTPPTPPVVPVDPEEKNPDYSVEKSVASTGSAAGGKYKAGEKVKYEIVVENTGNVTLYDITVEDKLTNESNPNAKVTFTDLAGGTLNDDNTVTLETLAVGESVTLKAEYKITQADVDAQKTITNVATAKGKDPDEEEVDPKDPTPVPVKPEKAKAGISVTKSADRTTGLRQGDTVRYTIKVKNTGNVTLTGVKVSDSLVKFKGDKGKNIKLAPGKTAKITYNYTVTAADVRAGRVVNTATARGTAPNGKKPSASDRVTARTRANGGGGGNPGGGGGNPGGPVVTPGDGDGNPGDGNPADGTVVQDEPVPEVEPEVEIEEPETPLAGGAWALVNLICAVVTALGAIVALFRKKEEDDEDEDEQNKPKTDEEDEEDNRGKKMLASKIAGAVAGVAGPVAFILTEDMTLPMQMVDKWTLLMVVILAAQIVAAVFNKKASELDDEEEEEAGAAAN